MYVILQIHFLLTTCFKNSMFNDKNKLKIQITIFQKC